MKEARTIELLRKLAKAGVILDDRATKGRKYRKSNAIKNFGKWLNKYMINKNVDK